MNIKKLYRYLLFSGLMAQAFTPIGSLALKVQNGQMMLFGVSWSPTMDVHTSLIQSEAKYFPDDNGNVLYLSNGAPVEPKVGSFGIFLKNNANYLFRIIGPGTARTLGANEYHWIRNSVVSKFMNDSAGVMYPYAVMQGIFSCIDSNLSDKLDQNRIYNYLGGRNDYVLRSFYAIMEDFFRLLNDLKNEDRQAMDFSTLYYKIRLCFVIWLYNMASEAMASAYINEYKKLGDPISTNWDKDKIANYAAIIEFWSNPANAGICEFWNATMAWFLYVFEERGVGSANGESLIKFAIAELQWLKECVDLFLRNGQLNDEAMINVTTKGCMVQLKNYCYLLYHYKEKIYRALTSLSIDMNNDDRLRQIKASLDNLCKQWNGRELADIMDKKSNKYQSWLGFLGDGGRNNALNVEAVLNNLQSIINSALNDNTGIYNDTAKENMRSVARYINDMRRVLWHMRNYSSYIKDNSKTYYKKFAPAQGQPGSKMVISSQQIQQNHGPSPQKPVSFPQKQQNHGQHTPAKNHGPSPQKPVSFPQKQQNHGQHTPAKNLAQYTQKQGYHTSQQKPVSSAQKQGYHPSQQKPVSFPQKQGYHTSQQDHAPSPWVKKPVPSAPQQNPDQYTHAQNPVPSASQQNPAQSSQNDKSNAKPSAPGAGQNINVTLHIPPGQSTDSSPQNKIPNYVASAPPPVPLNNVVSPVQNDTYTSLASMTLPGSSAGSSLYNTYTPSKGKTFMSKTLSRKGKMRFNLDKTARSNKSSRRRGHSKSRKNLKGGKKHKHREVAN